MVRSFFFHIRVGRFQFIFTLLLVLSALQGRLAQPSFIMHLAGYYLDMKKHEGLPTVRYVGIFYQTPHTHQSQWEKVPYDISNIMERKPEATDDYSNPIWQNENVPFHLREHLFD